MLVLSRKPGEVINIGENIKLVILEVHGRQVRIGIEAPREVQVTRPNMKKPFLLDISDTNVSPTG